MNKAAHSGFEIQRRRHQKSKTGVSLATQKGFPKNIWKKGNELQVEAATLAVFERRSDTTLQEHEQG